MGTTHHPVIIGAGIAGLAAARALVAAGDRPILIDKGRQVGGRMASRRFRGLRFDTGAQFFTAFADSFRTVVESAERAGAVARWYEREGNERHPSAASVYRGASAMTDLTKHLRGELDGRAEFRLHTLVESVSPGGDGAARWRMTATAQGADAGKDATVELETDRLIVTAPVAQTLALVAAALDEEMRTELEELSYHPCLALLIDPGASMPIDLTAQPGYGMRRFADGPVQVITDNGAKGLTHPDSERAGERALTVHFAPEISRELYELDDEEIRSSLVEAFAEWPAGSGDTPTGVADPSRWAAETRAADREGRVQLKKWRYAQPVAPYPERTVEAAPGLFLAGDMFGGARVEGAFLSGQAAGEARAGT